MSARTGGTRVDPNDAGAPGEAAFREQELRLPPVSVPALLVLLCVPLAVAAALLAMVFSGAFLTGTALLDPGDLVTYGLPVARTLHDIAATATVGFLAVAPFLAPGQTKRPGMLGWAQSRATRWAGWAGAAWFACALAVLLLTGVSVSGVQPGDALFWPTLGTFLFGVELGQSLVVSAVAVLVAAVVAALAHRITTAGVALGFAVFAMLPLALSGHAAGAS